MYLKETGYGYKQCRRKGILLKEDLDRSLKFAKKCKRLPPTFWIEGTLLWQERQWTM